MTNSRPETNPATVPAGATQAGEARARWAWTEPCVWTERMLTTLEQGVKGGVWFSLVDKVYALRTLRRAFADVKANHGAAGVDQVTVAMYAQHLEANLATLSQQLRDGSYRPQMVRRMYIEKDGGTGQRPLGIPTVQDRLVQTALEPIFERDFAAQSYGFRPGRGCKDALRRVQALLDTGHTHVVDADLQRYFDSIPHDQLLARVRQKVADGRVLALLEGFLTQQVMDGLRTWMPDGGTPQGAVISPLLANIYLDGLDHDLVTAGYEMVRYADDLVILCRTRAEADAALAHLTRWTTAAGLQLHPTKTHVVDATAPGGFDFLGYHFERGYRWPRRKSLRKLKDRLRRKTLRTQGHSLSVIIADVNHTLHGWFQYFQHSHWTTFAPLDRWVRMRLRSILRKRHGRRGRGRGADHYRWPNAFFAAQGLLSLTVTHAQVRQSVLR